MKIVNQLLNNVDDFFSKLLKKKDFIFVDILSEKKKDSNCKEK